MSEHHLQLLCAYYDSDLAVDELAELEAWLNADADHAALFARYGMMHRQIREHFRNTDLEAMLWSSGEAEDNQPLIEALALEEKAAAARAESQRMIAEQKRLEEERRSRLAFSPDSHASRTVRHIVIPRPVVYAAVAGLAAMLLLLVYTFSRTTPTPTSLTSASSDEPTVNTPQDGSFCRLTAITGARWAAEHAPSLGEPLLSGEHRLIAGIAQLSFENGATLTIEAPATFNPRAINSVQLAQGKLVGHCPPTAQGFSVDTPRGRVVDLGTEFGVHVADDGDVHVQVFTGSVLLQADEITGEQKHAILRAGDAHYVSHDGMMPVAAVSDFIRTAPSPTQWSVMQLQPLLYLAFDDANAITSGFGTLGATGEARGKIASVGRLDEKDALQLDGDARLDMGVLPIDASRGLSIVAWVKPSTDLATDGRIASNRGNDTIGGFGFSVAGRSSHLKSTPGTLCYTAFGLVDQTSAVQIPLGEWSHVAVTVDQQGVALMYINGRAVDVNTLPFEVAEPVPASPSTRPLTIGANPPHDALSLESWSGALDEVAIFDRMLSPDEIATLYESR